MRRHSRAATVTTRIYRQKNVFDRTRQRQKRTRDERLGDGLDVEVFHWGDFGGADEATQIVGAEMANMSHATDAVPVETRDQTETVPEAIYAAPMIDAVVLAAAEIFE
jgi:hypothetical protein